MATELNDQDQTRLALAALTAAFAHALGEQDESFASRVAQNLESLHRKMSEEHHRFPIKTLDTLRWTNELLKELRSQAY